MCEQRVRTYVYRFKCKSMECLNPLISPFVVIPAWNSIFLWDFYSNRELDELNTIDYFVIDQPFTWDVAYSGFSCTFVLFSKFSNFCWVAAFIELLFFYKCGDFKMSGTSADLDDVFVEIGEFGPNQIITFVLLFALRII